MKNPKFPCPFSRKFLKQILIRFSALPQPVGCLKLMLNLFLTINIQIRELCLRDVIKYAFDIDLRPDTCEPICLYDARHD